MKKEITALYQQLISITKIIIHHFLINHLCFQFAFQHLYGCSISKFSREARLEKAYILLKANKYLNCTICMMVAYEDAANFSVAFRNHYGSWPGEIQKRSKQ